MSEDGSRGECLFEKVESITTGEVKLPGNILLGEEYQWNNNIQIVEDELVVEVSEF